MNEEIYQEVKKADYEQVLEPVKRKFIERVQTKARNEREYWLEETAKMLNRSIPMIAKKLEGFSAKGIKEMYLYANREDTKRKGIAPGAIWWNEYKKVFK